MIDLPKDQILAVAKSAVSVNGKELAKLVREYVEEDRRRREVAQQEFITDEQQRARAAFMEVVRRSLFEPMLRPPQSDADVERWEQEDILVAETLEHLGVTIHPLTLTQASVAALPLLAEAQEQGLDPQVVAETALWWITEQAAAQIADLLIGGNRDELMITAPEAVSDLEIIEHIDNVLREEMGMKKAGNRKS